MCVFVCVYMGGSMCTCGGQMKIVNVLLFYVIPYIPETGSSINLELS